MASEAGDLDLRQVFITKTIMQPELSSSISVKLRPFPLLKLSSYGPTSLIDSFCASFVSTKSRQTIEHVLAFNGFSIVHAFVCANEHFALKLISC